MPGYYPHAFKLIKCSSDGRAATLAGEWKVGRNSGESRRESRGEI